MRRDDLLSDLVEAHDRAADTAVLEDESLNLVHEPSFMNPLS